MKIMNQDTSFADGTITVTTEHDETLTLVVKGSDGAGHYAVEWDAGEKQMAGQFVDFEDGSELYECRDDSTFRAEDGTELTAVQGQDGGFSWGMGDAHG